MFELTIQPFSVRKIDKEPLSFGFNCNNCKHCFICPINGYFVRYAMYSKKLNYCTAMHRCLYCVKLRNLATKIAFININ